jgi:hypothetical protein
MPQELLKLIKALETYKAENAMPQALPDKLTVCEFIEMMGELLGEKPAAERPAPAEQKQEFIQCQGSYKVLSLDGSITAMDIASTDLVQVAKDYIQVVWPHTSVDFTLEPDKGPASISKEEFLKFAEFVAQ